jgi:AraC-like DNA-binding protein
MNRLSARESQRVPGDHAPMPRRLPSLEAEVRSRLFVEDVVRQVAFYLPHGGCRAEIVARALYITRRTLHRRLRQRRTSYSQILHDQKRELVLRLLANADIRLTDAAWTAGFSSSSALTHWCRRVLGSTPTDLRDRLVSARYGRIAARWRAS